MGRFAFWILCAACLIAAGGLYAVKIRGNVAAIRDLQGQVTDATIASRTASAEAMGEDTTRRLRDGQAAAREALYRAHRFFAERDGLNADLWFPEFGIAWDKTPQRPRFQTVYSFAVDMLTREVTAVLTTNGVRASSIAMIDYPWRNPRAEPPATSELRELQRTYWLQDRLHRAFARVGGRLSAPLKADSVAPALGRADAIFDGTRWIASIECSTERVEEVLHALDKEFQVHHEDGQTSDVSVPVIVNDVSVAALDLDSDKANQWLAEPPVRLTFFLTALDYREQRP